MSYHLVVNETLKNKKKQKGTLHSTLLHVGQSLCYNTHISQVSAQMGRKASVIFLHHDSPPGLTCHPLPQSNRRCWTTKTRNTQVVFGVNNTGTALLREHSKA